MKMENVEVVIRRSKFSGAKAGLNQVGVDFIKYRDVMGVSRQTGGGVYGGIV